MTVAKVSKDIAPCASSAQTGRTSNHTQPWRGDFATRSQAATSEPSSSDMARSQGPPRHPRAATWRWAHPPPGRRGQAREANTELCLLAMQLAWWHQACKIHLLLNINSPYPSPNHDKTVLHQKLFWISSRQKLVCCPMQNLHEVQTHIALWLDICVILNKVFKICRSPLSHLKNGNDISPVGSCAD